MKKILLPSLTWATVLLSSCGGNTETKIGEKQPLDGKSVYEAQCTRCHGSNGKMGLSGAKDLTITTFSEEEMVTQIANGSSSGIMPAYKDVLSVEEIKAVANYIETNLKN